MPRNGNPDAALRRERIARRVDQASRRESVVRAGPLPVELTEALLIAHDLFMIGEIDTAPSRRWSLSDAQAALAPWAMTVLPDGSLSRHTPSVDP